MSIRSTCQLKFSISDQGSLHFPPKNNPKPKTELWEQPSTVIVSGTNLKNFFLSLSKKRDSHTCTHTQTHARTHTCTHTHTHFQFYLVEIKNYYSSTLISGCGYHSHCYGHWRWFSGKFTPVVFWIVDCCRNKFSFVHGGKEEKNSHW